jgi:hypothetical protein
MDKMGVPTFNGINVHSASQLTTSFACNVKKMLIMLVDVLFPDAFDNPLGGVLAAKTRLE